MFNRKVLLDLDTVYYNMKDLLDALLKYYTDRGTICSVIGKDSQGNPILLINFKTYELRVKNVTPGMNFYYLLPDEKWPPLMSMQQVILKEL
ncbi:hypothetical protein [Clostridium sp. Ade.TY]|uniref:hypothetical protein n=1 Tax=Clostridium sp. Ade.TY TaxID=1391647 RepID=UPI00042819C2|nr:hypothetical protein [Clostridium sp. Ade.TY]